LRVEGREDGILAGWNDGNVFYKAFNFLLIKQELSNVSFFH